MCAGDVSPEQGCVPWTGLCPLDRAVSPGTGDAVCPVAVLKKGSRFFAADCQGLARMKRGGVLGGCWCGGGGGLILGIG